MKRHKQVFFPVLAVALAAVFGFGLLIVQNPPFSWAQTPDFPYTRTQKQTTFFEKWPTETPTPLPTATPIPIPTVTPSVITCGTVDIVVLNDTSASMQTPDFNLQMEFNKKLIDRIDPKPEKAHMGFTLFDSGVYPLIGLTGDKASLLKAVPTVRDHFGGTMIGAALTFGDKELDKSGRSDAARILLLVTDGGSTDVTVPLLKEIRDNKTNILTVGVGNGTQSQLLLQIAGDPARFFQVNDFGTLVNTVDQIADTTCAITNQSASSLASVSLTEQTEVCPSGTGKKAGCMCESVKTGKGESRLCTSTSRSVAGSSYLYRKIIDGEKTAYSRLLGNDTPDGIEWEQPADEINKQVYESASALNGCREVCLEIR